MTRTRQVNHCLQNPPEWAPGICESPLNRNDAGAARMAADRDRQRIALRLTSPMRANPGRTIASQADAGHLPLFIAATEPTLL